eukprot:10052536-Ditylum_brightwellii.AAC.1
MEVDACWVLALTEGSMPESKTAGDACTCTVIPLEDSGVVAFVSSSDGFFSFLMLELEELLYVQPQLPWRLMPV